MSKKSDGRLNLAVAKIISPNTAWTLREDVAVVNTKTPYAPYFTYKDGEDVVRMLKWLARRASHPSFSDRDRAIAFNVIGELLLIRDTGYAAAELIREIGATDER